MPNPNLLQAEQIEKYLMAPIAISAFAAAGTGDIVTAELTAAAIANGVIIAVSNGVDTLGYITSGVNNKVQVKEASSETGIVDDAGNEVYGRLTEAATVYTLSYYSIVAGVETAFTMPATTVDAYFNYLFDFSKLPVDSLIRLTALVVGEDPTSGAGKPFNESIAITGTNILNPLTKLPAPGTTVWLAISGKVEFEGGAFTRSSLALTWVPTSRYDLVAGKYYVRAFYNTLEA